MSFYLKLRDALSGKVKNLDELPRGYQIIGNILVIRLRPGLVGQRKAIGKAVLGFFPYIRTVVLQKDIGGEKRQPKVEVIAGAKDTRTVHREHGCLFEVDLAKVMWSQGNKAEKERLANLVKPKETVVDMFAGIGYFSVMAAKRAKRLYAIDINHDSTELLRRNVLLNHLESKVEILEGDCRKFAPLLEGVADRVFMGYLFETEKFLPYALKIAKKNVFIHLHRNVRLDEINKLKEKLIEIGKKHEATVKVVNVQEVKSYAPKVIHAVFDLKIRKA